MCVAAVGCVLLHQTVDGEVVMLSAHWEKRRTALVELEEQLQQVPAFLGDLETVTSRIGEAHSALDCWTIDGCLRLQVPVSYIRTHHHTRTVPHSLMLTKATHVPFKSTCIIIREFTTLTFSATSLILEVQ